MNDKKESGINYLYIIGGIIVIFFILVCVPMIVNFFMSFNLGVVYGDENVWIPSLSTYYGAILGGGISGLLTLLGVKLTLKTSTEEVNKTILEQRKIRDEEFKYNSVKEQVLKLYNPIIAFQNKMYMKYGKFNFNTFLSEEKDEFIKIISENELYADSNLYNELLSFSYALERGDSKNIHASYRKVISITRRDIDTKKESIGLPIQMLELF